MNWTLFLDWILYDVLASPINTYMILKQQPVPCVQLLLYDFSGNTTTDLHRCALYHHRMRLLLFAYCRLCFRLCEPRPSDFSLRFFGFWYFYWFQIVFEFCVGYSFDLWFHSTIHESIVWHSIGSSVRRWMHEMLVGWLLYYKFQLTNIRAYPSLFVFFIDQITQIGNNVYIKYKSQTDELCSQYYQMCLRCFQR